MSEQFGDLTPERLEQLVQEGRGMKVSASCRFTEAGLQLTVDAGTLRADLFVDRDEVSEIGAVRLMAFIRTLPEMWVESLNQIGEAWKEVAEDDQTDP